MIHRPIIRRVSYAVASSLLAVTLLGPAGARAATPSLFPDFYGAPATVSAGGTGAIALTIRNDDKSTVSQLFLINIAVSGAQFLGAIPSQGTCDGTTCTLGQLKPKKTATVFVVFTAPAEVGPVEASGLWNTTGIAGTGDNSHGDAWIAFGSALVSIDGQDFAGRFIDSAGNVIVENSQTLSDANPHSTKVVAPKTLIGVSVQDGPYADEPTCLLSLAECENLFGDPSVINVAQGGFFTGGFQIIIGFDKSEIVGANANTLTIYHTYIDPSSGEETYEIIDTKCSFAPNSSVPKSLPCLTVDKLGGGDLLATIWTTHNGTMKGLS